MVAWAYACKGVASCRHGAHRWRRPHQAADVQHRSVVHRLRPVAAPARCGRLYGAASSACAPGDCRSRAGRSMATPSARAATAMRRCSACLRCRGPQRARAAALLALLGPAAPGARCGAARGTAASASAGMPRATGGWTAAGRSSSLKARRVRLTAPCRAAGVFAGCFAQEAVKGGAMAAPHRVPAVLLPHYPPSPRPTCRGAQHGPCPGERGRRRAPRQRRGLVRRRARRRPWPRRERGRGRRHGVGRL